MRNAEATMAESAPHTFSPDAGSARLARPPQGTVTADGTLAVYEPGSGRLVGEVRVSSRDDVREAVRAARSAQSEWARRTFRARAEVLLRFKQIVLDRAEEIGDLIVRENGKTKNEALFMEVLPVADLTHFFAKHAQRILRDE